MIDSFDSTDAVSIILLILCGMSLISNNTRFVYNVKTDKSFPL